MGVFAGPEINEDGLVLALDAGNLKSYNVGISSTIDKQLPGQIGLPSGQDLYIKEGGWQPIII